MDENFDNRSGLDGGLATRHLMSEQFTAYLDGDLAAADRVRIDDHIRSCAECRVELAQIRSTVILMRGLPEYRPRRSFRLSPDRAAMMRPWWERLGLRVLP